MHQNFIVQFGKKKFMFFVSSVHYSCRITRLEQNKWASPTVMSMFVAQSMHLFTYLIENSKNILVYLIQFLFKAMLMKILKLNRSICTSSSQKNWAWFLCHTKNCVNIASKQRPAREMNLISRNKDEPTIDTGFSNRHRWSSFKRMECKRNYLFLKFKERKLKCYILAEHYVHECAEKPLQFLFSA